MMSPDTTGSLLNFIIMNYEWIGNYEISGQWVLTAINTTITTTLFKQLRLTTNLNWHGLLSERPPLCLDIVNKKTAYNNLQFTLNTTAGLREMRIE